jgi:spermidine synthase
LFDDYEASSTTIRTSAPFLCEGKRTLSLHFDTVGVQSLMDLEAPNRLMLGYTRTMMRFLSLKQQPQHIGMVGLGGGSMQKYCYQHLPQSRISVAEISPEVIALRDRFCIPNDDHRFQVTCEDGAEFVARHRDEFDVLIIDGFDSTGQPPELCSQDFYHRCYDALAPEGFLVVNICDSGHSMLIPRLQRSFQNRVIVLDGEDSTNTIAFAGKVSASLHDTSRRQILSSSLRNEHLSHSVEEVSCS